MTLGIAVVAMQFMLLAQPAGLRPPARRPETYYTIQILSVRAENRQALAPIYRSLRAEGHLVYCYPKRLGDRQYVRLRVGVFDQRAAAQAYGRELARKKGFDYFVTKAEVVVERFGGRFRIVTTPSGIWFVTNGSVKELYAPGAGWIDREHTVPQISPDGTAIAFYAEQRILTVAPDTGQTRVLPQSNPGEALLNSVVRWSPDGRYLAYLDAAEWELPTRLWVMRTDGTENHCLVADSSSRTKVKSFEWHPRLNRIFYVIGPTHGTVSKGGSLGCIDLDGTHRTLVETRLDEGTEVVSEFRIANGLLQYCLAHHQPEGTEPRYSFHERSLDSIDRLQ